MKALILRGKHDVHVGEFPTPEMNDDSVKIAIRYCGVCGTDLHKYEGISGSRPLTFPVPLGHEISGIVEAVGKNVRGIKPGDRVTADPNWSCGRCRFCRKGLVHMCENSRGVVKGMADYIAPPQENVYLIPDSLSLRDAALTEPLSCCLHGMDLLDLKLGETVAIIGMGAIGSMFVQLCKSASAGKVIVIETDEGKRDMAFRLGATDFINPAKENPAEVLEQKGISVDKVLECVGFPATVNSALDVAGKGARVVLFGMGDASRPVPINTYQAMVKELDIQTSFLNPHAMQRSLDLLEQGAIDTQAVVSKEMTAEELIEELKNRCWTRKGKVIVKWENSSAAPELLTKE